MDQLKNAFRKLLPHCAGKQRHATREDAQAHIDNLVSMNAKYGQEAKSVGLGFYECRTCVSFHVGRSGHRDDPVTEYVKEQDNDITAYVKGESV